MDAQDYQLCLQSVETALHVGKKDINSRIISEEPPKLSKNQTNSARTFVKGALMSFVTLLSDFQTLTRSTPN